ncbi:recombinase family protein [Sorangium sp. So ce834]|uniref:recombinase family protein n=1 Tax=Sorangium sp. So ce834 TaxID=3133321 RepID=UPI003F6461DC
MARLAIRKVLLEHANPLIDLLGHPELPIELLDQRQPAASRLGRTRLDLDVQLRQPQDGSPVLVRDESRLGGDMNRTSPFIQNLLDTGVWLFYYFTDEEVRIDGAVDKGVLTVRNFASELEREKISQRTHEHLPTKARRGLNVGGRVYGYDNIEIEDGDRRVRVEYKINEEQAKIVREIFRRYAAGEGLRTIAKDLNARGVEPPGLVDAAGHRRGPPEMRRRIAERARGQTLPDRGEGRARGDARHRG